MQMSAVEQDISLNVKAIRNLYFIRSASGCMYVMILSV